MTTHKENCMFHVVEKFEERNLPSVPFEFTANSEIFIPELSIHPYGLNVPPLTKFNHGSGLIRNASVKSERFIEAFKKS